MSKSSKNKKNKGSVKRLWIVAAIGILLILLGALIFALRGSVWVPSSIDSNARIVKTQSPETPDALSSAYRLAPGRIEKEVSLGKKTYLFSVQNSSKEAVRVEVAFYKSSIQSLDGSLVVADSIQARERGKEFLRLSQREFSLKPGGTQIVRGKLMQKPEGEALTGMIYARFVPPLDSKKLNTAIRLGAFTQLRLSGYRSGSSELQKVLPVPSEDGRVDFRLQAVNNGREGLSRPKGEISVRNSAGDVVWSDDLLYGQGILPGQRRDLRLRETSVALSPGSYTVRGSLSGQGSGSSESSFRVDSSGSLPSPSLLMEGRLSGDTLALDQPFSVEAILRSTSSEDFPVTVQARVFSLDDELLYADRSSKVLSIAPGDLRQQKLGMDALYQAGDYLVSLEARSEDGDVLSQQQLALRVLPTNDDISSGQSLRTWLENHPEVTLLLGMLFALLGVGAIVVYYVLAKERKRQRRIERRRSGRDSRNDKRKTKQAKKSRTRKGKR